MDGAIMEYINWNLVVAALSLVTSGLLLPTLRWIHKIRTNELHHLAEGQERIERAIERLDAKVDRHLEWHLDRGDK